MPDGLPLQARLTGDEGKGNGDGNLTVDDLTPELLDDTLRIQASRPKKARSRVRVLSVSSGSTERQDICWRA